jgi:hypothetical protein
MSRVRSSARFLALSLLVPSLGTCHRHPAPTDAPAAEPAEAAAALRGWHYEVTVASSLASADVRVCFEGRPPDELVPGAAAAAPHTRDVRRPDGEALPRRGRAYALASLGDDACMSYTVDLASLETGEGTGQMVGRTGGSLMARPSAWLWRPDTLPAGADVTVRFSLPEGMQVSVPWPTLPEHPRGTDDATYVLDATAFDWLSFVVLGELTVDRFERAGAQVELVTLDARVACPPAGLHRWVEDAVDTVALLFDGRFPRERLQLVVIPVEGGGGGTVYFGMAARGGGAGVQIFLDDQARAEALPGGWTTVHELLHHGMPFIEEPWMAEGWVSYYTELMRTRAGHRSELEGWNALLDGFRRGRDVDVDMTLAQTSEKMHETHAYQRVYWGGAAVALLADVEMRLETHGARGLDDAMKELRRCCGDADHQWTAQALLERLDAWYGRPLFTHTAQAVLDERDLPDVEAAMARLGIGVGIDGKVVLDDEHPAAALRRAIMAPVR